MAETEYEDLIIAIGDVHGQFFMLQQLLRKLMRIEKREIPYAAEYMYVFLGDLIDRGPHSKQVVQFVRAMVVRGNAVAIRGNHEDWMIEAVLNKNKEAFRSWLSFGGIQTRASYGVLMPEALEMKFTDEEIEDAGRFKTLPLHHVVGKRVFVHAGLNPEVKLGNQTKDFRLWARPNDFMDRPNCEGYHVVFGHTPRKRGGEFAPIMDSVHYTGLDTGACFPRGTLSAGLFRRDTVGWPIKVVSVPQEVMWDKVKDV